MERDPPLLTETEPQRTTNEGTRPPQRDQDMDRIVFTGSKDQTLPVNIPVDPKKKSTFFNSFMERLSCWSTVSSGPLDGTCWRARDQHTSVHRQRMPDNTVKVFVDSVSILEPMGSGFTQPACSATDMRLRQKPVANPIHGNQPGNNTAAETRQWHPGGHFRILCHLSLRLILNVLPSVVYCFYLIALELGTVLC